MGVCFFTRFWGRSEGCSSGQENVFWALVNKALFGGGFLVFSMRHRLQNMIPAHGKNVPPGEKTIGTNQVKNTKKGVNLTFLTRLNHKENSLHIRQRMLKCLNAKDPPK